MDVAKVLAKVLDQPQVAKVMRVLDIYGHAAGGLLANGLAFSALFASIPAALLVIGVGGFIAAGSTEAQQKLVDALIEAFPPLADLINGAVTAVSQGAALTSIIGFFGVIWTVSQFYGAIDVAFARIFAASPERDIVRRTARGFLVVVLIGIAIVGFVVLVSAATYLDALIPTQIPVATSIVNVLRSIPFLILLAIGVDPGDLPVPAAERATLAVGADPGDPVGIIVVVLTQIFTLLVPRLVGVAALAGPSRPRSSRLRGCRSRSRRSCMAPHGCASGTRVPTAQRPRSQRAWGVPQRRQNRAFAESDSPQLTHGCTPVAAAGVAPETARVDSAHRASTPPVGAAGRPRKGRPAAGRLPRYSGRGAGHCGSAEAAAGSAGGSAGGSRVMSGVESGATIRHVGCRTMSLATGTGASGSGAGAAARAAAARAAAASSWSAGAVSGSAGASFAAAAATAMAGISGSVAATGSGSATTSGSAAATGSGSATTCSGSATTGSATATGSGAGAAAATGSGSAATSGSATTAAAATAAAWSRSYASNSASRSWPGRNRRRRAAARPAGLLVAAPPRVPP